MPEEAKLLTELKRHGAALKRIVVFNGDDDEKGRAVAVPERRRKWDQVIRAVNGAAWSRVELQNGKGEVLAYVANDAPAGDLETLSEGTGPIRQAQAIANLVLVNVRAIVKDVQSAHAEEMRTLMATQAQLVGQYGQAMQGLAKLYEEQASVARAMADERASTAIERMQSAATESPDEFAKLMESLPALLQLATVAKTMLSPGASASAGSPLNGKAK